MSDELPGNSPDGLSTASDLCVSCGLCCSGPMFTLCKLKPGEEGVVAALGLSPGPHEGAFGLPCPLIKDKCCTIYDQRPQGCRSYRCEILLDVEAGRLEVERAREIIAEAVELFEGIGIPFENYQAEQDAILSGDGSPPDARSVRRRLDLITLQRLLDRHFRSDRKQRGYLIAV